MLKFLRKNKINKYIGLNTTLQILQIIILVAGLYLTITQIQDLRKINAGQIALDITRDIYSPERYPNNPNLIKLLERNRPILKINHGEYDEQDLDNLLGEWDIVARLNQAEVLPDDLVYSQFSFDLTKAYKSKEVMGYVKSVRKQYGDDLIFADFQWLAEWADKTSKE